MEIVNKEMGARPILWHDMMKDWTKKELTPLVGKTDIMFWSYSAYPWKFVRLQDMRRFSKLGLKLWGAGLYKGGKGAIPPSGQLADIKDRIQNMCTWVKACKEFKLEGIVATGWARVTTLNRIYNPLESLWDSANISPQFFK